jgi:DNA-binding HxlR family transcriptional regulator
MPSRKLLTVGRTLLKAVREPSNWAFLHRKPIERARAAFDQRERA